MRNKKYIIGGLIGLCVLMTIAYGAFLTNLNINGTTSITSNWNVLITNIESKTIVGNASNEKEPTHDKLSATFSTKLESPGDSIEYEITVANQGNIDAVLKKVTLSDSNNPAIKFTTSGLLEGELLNKGKSKTFIVKVEYLSDVTMQPENTTANLTVTLEYTQKNVNDEGISTPEKEEIDMKGVTVPLVTHDDGLYEDEYEIGRYVYKGANPNNWIKFNNEDWRIIATEADGTIKIMKNPKEMLPDRVFDSPGARITGYCGLGSSTQYGCNAWAKTGNYKNTFGNSGAVETDSEIKTYLNGEYYTNTITANKNDIQAHDFYYGSPTFESTNLSTQITEERKYSANSNVGLIESSDYIKSNSNTNQCGTFKLIRDNGTACKSTSWMVKELTNKRYYWTLTPKGDGITNMIDISYNGRLEDPGSFRSAGVVPVVYLKPTISLSGNGTQLEPYKIN